MAITLMSNKSKLCWIKEKTFAKDFEALEASPTDPLKDFVLDPSGFYVLIKILPQTSKIAVAICNAQHEIIKSFEGRSPRDLWTAIFNYEESNHLKWFTRKDHAAYLGKELKKAELALNTKTDYVQE